MKDVNSYIQEVQQTLSRIKSESYINTYYNQTFERKEKERLKRTKQKAPGMSKESSGRVTFDFSSSAMEARRKWGDRFSVLKESSQPRIPCYKMMPQE